MPATALKESAHYGTRLTHRQRRPGGSRSVVLYVKQSLRDAARAVRWVYDYAGRRSDGTFGRQRVLLVCLRFVDLPQMFVYGERGTRHDAPVIVQHNPVPSK
jgi:hypothetical protein